jgi:hypothetical protein
MRATARMAVATAWWRAGGAVTCVRAAARLRAGGGRRQRGCARAADGGAHGRHKAARRVGDDEGEGTADGEGKRVDASRQESYMTGGPRRFCYRRLIRRLGFERRLIASV